MSARIYFKGKIALRRLLREQRAVHDLLLRHGGDDVLFEVDPATKHAEDTVAKLVTNFGFRFYGAVRKLPRARLNDCHVRAQEALAEHADNRFATGWALSDDDLWRPHSWVLRRGAVYEPTPVVREAYFGLVINAP